MHGHLGYQRRAMGLQDRIVGTRGAPSVLDPIWPKYKEAYKNVPVMSGADGNSYPSEAEVTGANADFIFADWRSAFSEYAWIATYESATSPNIA